LSNYCYNCLGFE